MAKNRPAKVTFTFFLVVALAYAQDNNTNYTAIGQSQSEIRQQLAEMIQGAIKRSTFSMPEGTNATTVPVLTSDEYAKAKQLGDKATSVLAEYLGSKTFFEQLLAIRLLGVIGTNAAKDMLDEFAEKAALIPTRSYALDFVAASGRPKDAAVLKKIAAIDPDSHVRSRAKETLQQYKKEHNLR